MVNKSKWLSQINLLLQNVSDYQEIIRNDSAILVAKDIELEYTYEVIHRKSLEIKKERKLKKFWQVITGCLGGVVVWLAVKP